MQKVRLEISGIAYSQTQSGSYVLTLSEAAGKRKLPIVIGGFEAQAIAVELEKMIPNRPLTHDLIKSFCITYDVLIKEVLIYKFVEGVFYSKLICEKDGTISEIDSRTSDAIALAVRFECPIYTYEFVLSSAGIILDDEETEESELVEEELNVDDFPQESDDVERRTLEDLEQKLIDSIDNEDYESASKIRDEIKRRSGN